MEDHGESRLKPDSVYATVEELGMCRLNNQNPTGNLTTHATEEVIRSASITSKRTRKIEHLDPKVKR